MDVADWLGSLGLERYEAAFRDNDVDAQMLPSLTADDLKEMGIASLGHRRRLLEAIAALRIESVPAGDPVRFSSAPADRPDAEPRRGYRRTPPAHRDVLRPGRFDGAQREARPRGAA